jgi:hypothetical protein
MKRNLAWRTTLGTVFAGVFLLQWTTSASDKTAVSVTYTKDVAAILRYLSPAGRNSSDVAAELQRSAPVGQVDSRSRG